MAGFKVGTSKVGSTDPVGVADVLPALGDSSEHGWLGLQSVVVGAVLASAAIASGNAQAQTRQHQDEVPYVTGNQVSYGQQAHSRRAQVEPVFIAWAQGDELPQAPTPTALHEPEFIPWSKIEAPVAWLPPSDDFAAPKFEEESWSAPFVVPQIAAAPTWSQDDLPVAAPPPPALEESEYLSASSAPVPFVQINTWGDGEFALATVFEDAAWVRPEWVIPQPVLQVFDAQDEAPTQAAEAPGDFYGQPYSQRARVDPVFIAWAQGDVLPQQAAPLAVDEEPWKPATAIDDRITSIVWATNEDALQAPALDDGAWSLPVTVRATPFPTRHFYQDEITTPAAPLGIDVDPWVTTPVILEPAKWVQYHDELRPTPAPPLQVDDSEWVRFGPVLSSADGIIWASDDDIAPAFAPEDSTWFRPTWSIPQPIRAHWHQDDPLPVAAAPLGIDVDPWVRATVVLEPAKWLAHLDELIVPPAAPLQVEDDAWWPQVSRQKEADGIIWATDDDIAPAFAAEDVVGWPLFPTAPLARPFTTAFSQQEDGLPRQTVFEDDSWQPIVPPPVAAQPIYLIDAEVFTEPVPLHVNDDYWLDWPAVASTPAPIPTLPYPVEEEFPELVAPVVEPPIGPPLSTGNRSGAYVPHLEVSRRFHREKAPMRAMIERREDDLLLLIIAAAAKIMDDQ